MSLQATPSIKPGDTIAVVAPAGPVPKERLKAGLRYLESRYRVQVSEDIFRKSGFLAGDDERRAEEWNQALCDPEVRAVWAARGGYGCSRIVDRLDADAFRADPKPIVGFSDLTVLLSWVNHQGFVAIHGPTVTQYEDVGVADFDWVFDLLEGKGKGTVLPFEDAISGREAGNASMRGQLCGGNLSLLAHICGTGWVPDYSKKIVLVEDVGERPYALDRYLMQLCHQTSGALRSAAAVVLGEFTRCEEDNEPTQGARDVVGQALDREKIPWRGSLRVGHGSRNAALPFGVQVELSGDGLQLLEAATQ